MGRVDLMVYTVGGSTCALYGAQPALRCPRPRLMPQFAHAQPAGELLTDRALDTLTGCALGLLVAIAIADRRAVDRAESALAAVDASHAAAARLMAQPPASDLAGLVHARRRLASALAELREAAEVASGEWRQRALPEENIAAAEHESRPMLAARPKLLVA
ncbi:hypothetical protein ACWDA7_33295 [Streptomyces sp. NPDC001156]